RAWHMAEVLAVEHDVVLVTTVAADRKHPSFSVRSVDATAMRDLAGQADVLVFQGGLLRDFPFLTESDLVIVADLYDPFHLENLRLEEHTSELQSRFDLVCRP